MANGGAKAPDGAAKGLDNLEALRRELRAIKYDGVLDEAGIAKGHADALLPLLSHALFFYSRHLAQYLADKGYNAAAKNDVRMVEGVFKMLREDFAYQPTVKVSQFFGGGYAQVKVSFVCDVIRLCKNKHQALWKKQRDGRLKVETKGYRPNARLQATKPSVSPAATLPKPVPKRREHTKSGSPQHHKSAQNQSGQALRAALTSIATSSGPLGPVGFGISSVSGQSSRAPQPQPPQPMSSTQSQHPVDLHATTTYVDEFDCEDAVSEPYELQASRPQFLNSSGPTYSRAHPNATTPTPSHFCEPVQCGELGGGQGPDVDFAQPAPAQIAHVEQHQVPPTRPAPSPGDIDAGVGSTLTKEDLTDFAAQMKSLVLCLDSRLGLFEARVDGSLADLQAKVTLMEGRLKFVERAPVAGGSKSASALSGASAPASPMKEPASTVAPQPSHVEYKPAAVAEAADASNQPGREVQVPVQRDDSHDDTLAFVEAVAARFSEARQYLVDTAAQQRVL